MRHAKSGEQLVDRQKWNSHLKKKYGITIRHWDALLVFQCGRCAACNEPLVDPCVDHDHTTGAVRGLLCDSCNRALGAAKDKPSVLIGLACYVDQSTRGKPEFFDALVRFQEEVVMPRLSAPRAKIEEADAKVEAARLKLAQCRRRLGEIRHYAENLIGGGGRALCFVCGGYGCHKSDFVSYGGRRFYCECPVSSLVEKIDALGFGELQDDLPKAEPSSRAVAE